MFRLTFQGFATYLGENELYDKNPDLAPIYIEQGQDYLINIFMSTGREYLEYVEILAPDKSCLAYIPYHRGLISRYWRTFETQEEPCRDNLNVFRYKIDRLRSKFSRYNQIVRLFWQKEEPR